MKSKFRAPQSEYQYGFHDNHKPLFHALPGISMKTIEEISSMKEEPEWMRAFRRAALRVFEKKEMPSWGADLSGIDFQKIVYYVKPMSEQARSWEDVPQEIKTTFERIGVPQPQPKIFL